MDIVKATKEFENWLGKSIDVVRSQIAAKHATMAQGAMPFLRGTFYRWAQLFPHVCAELADAAEVLSVGDLHIASFGSWRDGFGRLIWGVDDFDEAFPLPYPNDLVRLAVSAALDASEGEIAVGLGNVCDVILDGYRAGLSDGGAPFVLEEHHKWLRKIVLDRLDGPRGFWKKMDARPTARAVPREAEKALARLLPDPRMKHRVLRRTAGIGSLGHPRYVAVGDWHGGQIALEAKAATPSACAWSRPRPGTPIYYQQVLDSAVRCPDPFVRLCGKWVVRQLAPDSASIEIETMKGHEEQDRLLHAMARETANIHLGTKGAATRILTDLGKRPGRWLRSAAKNMAAATVRDWKDWRKHHGG